MRELNNATLDAAVRSYAGIFLLPTQWSPTAPAVARNGRDWVIQSMYGFAYADEFDYVRAGLKGYMGKDAYADFMAATADVFTPRSPDVLEAEHAARLAVRPDGSHIEGAKGRTQVGTRLVGMHPRRRLSQADIRAVTRWMRKSLAQNGFVDWSDPPDLAYEYAAEQVTWPIYAGEDEERAAGRVGEGTVIDDLPRHGEVVMALATRIANLAAIAALDAIVDLWDAGSTAATLRGRTGAQPAGPDATETGTLLFTLTYSDPAFGGATDADPGATVSAAAITDDSSADATDTLTYCRAGSTGAGADDLDDGSAGTSDADFIFNAVAIVTGANVSMSSHVITHPESV